MLLLGLFAFFAVWTAVALAPIFRFRVDPEKGLSSTVGRVERMALDVTRVNPSDRVPLEVILYP